ncbi:MAG: hypothetical protein IJM32_06530 [Ruminococcus sp.]|nr:hypothetical protein [Ruminococcus sp.]
MKEETFANIFTIVFLSLLILLCFAASIRYQFSKNKNKTEKKGRAKILFKSIDEYDGTSYPDLTTYHVTNYYIDCLIGGEKKTFSCCEYMYNYVQKGESYDVVYTTHTIELDRKYYPEDFDDYFENLDGEE